MSHHGGSDEERVRRRHENQSWTAVHGAVAVWIEDALVAALAGVGTGSLVHTVGHVIDHDLGGAPGVDIPFFAVLSIVLIAVAALRWRTLR
jgi:hypothetical protein